MHRVSLGVCLTVAGLGLAGCAPPPTAGIELTADGHLLLDGLDLGALRTNGERALSESSWVMRCGRSRMWKKAAEPALGVRVASREQQRWTAEAWGSSMDLRLMDPSRGAATCSCKAVGVAPGERAVARP